MAEELSRLVSSLEEGLANTMLNMSEDERMETLEAIRQLNNGIFARGASQNLQKTEMVTAAIKGAASLVSPEPLLKTEAQQMVDALRERYDIK